MVLQENMRAHAPIAGSTNPASRWICQQQIPSLAIIFMKNAYLE
jgi:hypothetical protein